MSSITNASDIVCSVTSVGGTTYGSSETAAGLSGGGFRYVVATMLTDEMSNIRHYSNIFSPPDYQSSVVSSYISSLGSTNSGLYNASGRGIPDVAGVQHKSRSFSE